MPVDFSGQRNVSIQGFMNGDSPCEPSREELIALIAAQAAKIAALEARIAELERRLGFNKFEQR